MRLKTGELARLTNTNAHLIHYYERTGVMPQADRGTGGQRTYVDEDVHRLIFIRRCRAFGLSLDQIKILLYDPGPRRGELLKLAQNQLAAIRAKRSELWTLEENLSALVENNFDVFANRRHVPASPTKSRERSRPP